MSKILEKFKRFEETIFFKNYNELEKQIQALQKLHDKYPNNEKISKELKLCEAGLRGENEIEYELKNADKGYGSKPSKKKYITLHKFKVVVHFYVT